MKFGARIIKTGIAVAITMYLCGVLGLEPAFFGAVSAVINMQPSIFLTYKAARDQIFVHILGVAAGFIVGYFFGVNPFSAGIIAITLISLYIKMNLQSGITMGIVAALFVLSSSTDEFIAHALARSGVIFVGLGSAMFINILLWPPRYKKEFKSKLKESNEEVVRYFCQAVQDYVQLGAEKPYTGQEQRAKAHKLNRETRALYELANRELDPAAGGPVKQGEWFLLAEKLVAYNQSLVSKADRIYDLIPSRFERRKEHGAPPVSEEFKVILELLDSGCETVTRINGKLRGVILEGAEAEAEQISEDYWEKLTEAIDRWKPKLTGSYYLHGLLEAAVTANEIKWAARQAKTLLYESTQQQTE